MSQKEQTYFQTMTENFDGYSPGGRISPNGVHIISREKLLHRGISDPDARVAALNAQIAQMPWILGVSQAILR